MKPKSNRKPGPYDNCQTPWYAIEPLVPFLNDAGYHTIWEPACGEGNIANALALRDFDVIATDIKLDFLNWESGKSYNFFDFETENEYDAIVTNPPYSIKYPWLERCYDLGKPFALLLPVETMGAKTAQLLFKAHGVQVIWYYPRVDFKMPNKGWSGKGAQFPTAWFTWQLNLPTDNVFTKLAKVKMKDE